MRFIIDFCDIHHIFNVPSGLLRLEMDSLFQKKNS